MRGFNNEDINKYEKSAKQLTNKLFKKSQNNTTSTSLRKLFTIKNILKTSILSLLLYGIHHAYQYNKHRGQHYIDIMKWKHNIANKVMMADLWRKISQFGEGNQELVLNDYESLLRSQMGQILDRVRSVNPLTTLAFKQSETFTYALPEQWQHQQQQQSEPTCNHPQQIILSLQQKSQLNLGYLFKLHTKQYMTTITANRQLYKKTYIIPVMICNVPFAMTKKQQTKKIGRKTSLSSIIQHKNQFKLTSECETINKWNLLLASNKVQKNQTDSKSKQINKQQDKSNSNTQKIGEETSRIQRVETQNKNQSKKQRQQLLFQCRQRVKKIQDQLVQKLKKQVMQKWGETGHEKYKQQDDKQKWQQKQKPKSKQKDKKGKWKSNK